MNNKKTIIYQLLPRLFTNSCDHCVVNGSKRQNGCGKMNDITTAVLNKIRDIGITHVWYTGVIRHALKTQYSGIPSCNPYIVKGNAGSPYAITDYYDIDPDIAVRVKNRIGEFQRLVARTHEVGMKVIIDFVPNHVARQYHSIAKPENVEDLGATDNKDIAFSPMNNFYYMPGQQFAPSIDLGQGDEFYYEKPAMATGNDCFHPYPGVNYMVPVEFWNWVIPQVKEQFPELIFIAELYDVGIYRDYIFNGHFDYLYDKVSLYDTLRAVVTGNARAAAITGCWQAVEGIGDHMLNFLENHDEQRIASSEFAGDATRALPALVVATTISRAPFMVYHGQELGEPARDAEGFSGRDGRTTIFDYWSVDTLRRWYNGGKCDTARLTSEERQLRRFYKKLLRLCNSEKAIAQGEFYDLMYVNGDSLNCDKVYAYYRHCEGEQLLIVANFNDLDETVHLNTPQHAFQVMGMEPGTYRCKELLSGSEMSLHVVPSEPATFVVPARNAVIIKLNRKD